MSRQIKNLDTYRFQLSVSYLTLYKKHLHEVIPDHHKRSKLIYDHWKSGVRVVDAAVGIHETEVSPSGE